MNGLISVMVALSALVLTACATLDRSECEAGDWASVGYQDGAGGFKPSRLTVHDNACARYGVVADQPAYLAGFNRGLVDFCVPPTGYRLGLVAENYHYLCPVEAEKAFLNAYVEGLGRTLALLDWRYDALEFRSDILRFYHNRPPTDDVAADSTQSRYYQLFESLDDTQSNIRFERLRVRGLLNRAQSHLQKMHKTGA